MHTIEGAGLARRSTGALLQEATPQCSIPGQVYMKCGSACPPSCAVPQALCIIDICIPGCQCPTGTVLSEDGCIPLEEC